MDRITQLEKQLAELSDKLANGVVAAAPAPAASVPEKPKAKPVEAPAVLLPTGKTDQEAWKEAVNILKKTDPGVYSFISQGKYAGCEGNLYRWMCHEGKDFFVTALNTDAKRKAVADALTAATGLPCLFEAIAPDSKQRDADSDEQDLLRSLGATFGKQNLLIQEEPR